MSDYIEREKLDNWLLTESASLDTQVDREYVVGRLREEIPSADVRPVVLCRDCAHCRKGKASLECEKNTYAWNNIRRWVNEDDFCSWGVKREVLGDE